MLQVRRWFSKYVAGLSRTRAWLMLALVASITIALVLCAGPQRLCEWPCSDTNKQSNDNILTAEAAIAILSQPEGGFRRLISFREITEDAAKEVARHKGTVDLSGLRTLPPSAARQLAQLPVMSTLILDGLEALPIDSAKALAGCRCRGLWLSGLKELTPALAAVLAQYGAECPQGSNLDLNGISRIPRDVMTALSRSHALVLKLRGLQQLDPDEAAALAEFRGQILNLDGLQGVSAETCEALSRFRGKWVSLSGVRELSPSAARSIAAFAVEKLYLDGLEHPSEEVLMLLRGFKGELMLGNATGDSPPEQSGAEDRPGRAEHDRHNPTDTDARATADSP